MKHILFEINLLKQKLGNNLTAYNLIIITINENIYWWLILFVKINEKKYILVTLDSLEINQSKSSDKRRLIFNDLSNIFYDDKIVKNEQMQLKLMELNRKYKQSHAYTCGFCVYLYSYCASLLEAKGYNYN